MGDEKNKKKDPMDTALDLEVMKKNLHRVMFENAKIIGNYLIFDKNIFATVVYNHGILTGSQAEQLFKLLLNSAIIKVKELPK